MMTLIFGITVVNI